MSALEGITIVELAERPAGEFCGKLLADFGAEVIKLEHPERGSPTRNMAPHRGEGPESGGLFAWLNTNKKSVALDPAKSAQQLHALLARAEAAIDDHDEDWQRDRGLSFEEIAHRHPKLVFGAITPYGQGAPRAWWNAKSLNVFHRSGWGYHTGSPDPKKPPLKGPGRFLADYEAGLDAAMSMLATLYWRGQSGLGQCIDISELEVLVSRADTVAGRMLAGNDPPSNARTAYTQGGPHGFFSCRNGTVYLYMTSRKHWLGLRALMGEPEWARNFSEDWLEFAATDEAVAICRREFGAWVKDLDKDEVSAKGQQLGVSLVPVNDAADLLRSAQFQFRGFFQSLRHPQLGEALYPTVPYKLSVTPAKLVAPAPALGQHTEEYVGAKSAPPKPRAQAAIERQQTDRTRGGPLAGVRVLELTKVWAGPYAGKLLAFLGAEVIKVESRKNPDEMRAYGGVDPDHAPYFLSLNPEIMSVQLNLKSEEGLGLLRQMVAKSDIVLNNLRPGAMERMGFDYDSMRAIKNDIISVSIKMFGTDGPLGYQTGYAPCFAALGGLNQLVGYEGEAPVGINMRYGDSTVGANAVFAALVALLHRERTGEGQFVDVSAVECMSSMVGDSLLEYGLTGNVPGPDGNFHADMAPHGCYPCRDDEWISIAIETDEEWHKLCDALGLQNLVADARYASRAARLRHRKDLDAILAELTQKEHAKGLGARLAAAGVPVSNSQSSLDLVSDEYLWNREFFRFVSDSKEGARPIVAAPWKLTQTTATITRGAPRLGEHNAYVYRDVLGLTDDKLTKLIRDGVVD